MYVTVPVTPVNGKPTVKIARSEMVLPRGTLVELTTVVRLGVDLVTVKAKVAAVDGV